MAVQLQSLTEDPLAMDQIAQVQGLIAVKQLLVPSLSDMVSKIFPLLSNHFLLRLVRVNYLQNLTDEHVVRPSAQSIQVAPALQSRVSFK